MEWSNYEFSYDDMITNEELSNVFNDTLIELGVNPEEINERSEGTGSLDMGNVSQVAPSIHPYVKICDEPFACHTHGFREAALSNQGKEAMILGAKTMAVTGYKILTNPELLQKIKTEFTNR